jgi:hypothetical protein
MTTPAQIADYLRSIPKARITSTKPCTLTIGKTVYPACRYTETLNTPIGCEAYRRGEREYTREMIYVTGMLPSANLRGNVAFTIAGESDEWYVATYFGNVSARKQETKEPTKFHPFGNNFLLAPWNVPDGQAIDHYARVPYRRVTVTIAHAD